MISTEFRNSFFELMEFPDNPYHALVWINGNPNIGKDTYIGGFTDINAKGANLSIGDNCDIASFVAINVADTHRQAIGLAEVPTCRDITIGNHVFIGSHCVVMGGTTIGSRSVIGAGSVVKNVNIPSFSLVVGNPAVVKPGYYKAEFEERGLLNSDDVT